MLNHFDFPSTLLAGNVTVTNFSFTLDYSAKTNPPGSKAMNLWCISAGATAYTNLFDGVGAKVPPEQIEIGSLGKLDTNGNLWVALKDNDPLTVTLAVAGKNYYTYTTPVATKYHPYIGLATSTTNANLDTDTPEVCVGQKVTFTLEGLPGYVDAMGKWTLPGTYVNTQYQYSAVCTSYKINADLLDIRGSQNPPQTFCWYVNEPGGRVGVNANLHFSNGQYASVAAQGNISVYRPQKIAENMNQDLVTPNLNPNIPSPPLYATNVNGWLQLGDSQGGYARFWAEYKSAYLGVFREAQIVQSCRKAGNDDPVDSGSQWWNDHAYNKGGILSIVSSVGGIAYAVQTDQYPGWPLKAPQTVVNDVFKTYFQFNPNPTGDGIWVTMGRVNWSWAATSTYTDGQWNAPSGTVSDPQYHDDDSFPLWNGNHP